MSTLLRSYLEAVFLQIRNTRAEDINEVAAEETAKLR